MRWLDGITDSNGHVCCCSVTQHVQLFVTQWTPACQASLTLTISWSLFKLMSIESVMPSNHLILCRPLLLLPSIFPSIRVFSSEWAGNEFEQTPGDSEGRATLACCRPWGHNRRLGPNE